MKNFRLNIYDWEYNEEIVLNHSDKTLDKFEQDVKVAFKIAIDLLLCEPEIGFIGNIELSEKIADVLCEQFGYSRLKEEGFFSINMTGIISDDGHDEQTKNMVDSETFNKLIAHNKKIDDDSRIYLEQ